MSDPRYWDHQRERGTPFMLKLLVRLTQLLGRGPMWLLLWPIAFYFWLTAGAARRSSREYLRRVHGKPVSIFAPLRHFHTFALTSVDRIYLLGGHANALDVTAHVPDEVLRAIAAGRGCILLVAHFGSFEAMRVRGTQRNESPIRIVLDRQVGRMAMSLLEALNPELATGIIDASQRGPELMLEIRSALQAGHIVGIMADRAREDERSATVRFMGDDARLPVGPWIIAGMLDAPVVLGFGVYRGGRRYECHLELFAERLELPRATREQTLQEWAQRYALRLEDYVRAAPYNWFNFYDFWHRPRNTHLAERHAAPER